MDEFVDILHQDSQRGVGAALVGGVSVAVSVPGEHGEPGEVELVDDMRQPA